MKRRGFLSGAAVAAAAAAIAKPAVAQGAPEVRWRLTSSFPKSLDTIFGTAETFAKYLSEATDGKFQIQTFAAGEIVPGLQALDAASNGTVECAHTPTHFYFGKEPALAIGTGLPFGLNARHQHSWWHFAGGEAIVNEALGAFNTIGFVCGNSGTQMGGWFRNEIRTLDDVKGLKFRIGGLGGQLFARLGAVPQQIAPGDIYPALERGVLDAVEFVGPYDDEKLGFNKVAKYYYYPGFFEGGAMLHLIVNKGAWEKLPKQYQSALRMCAEAANNWMLAKYDFVNAPALRRLVAGGTEIRAFPLPVLDAAAKAADELYAELSAKSPIFKKGFESMVAFRQEQYTWWQIAEYAFDSYQIRALRR
jgi:TRAP-type mannitol/chloroaromatic compound transport system substrate-binding protein